MIVVAQVESNTTIEIFLWAKAETREITQGLEDEEQVLKVKVDINFTNIEAMVIWLHGVDANQHRKFSKVIFPLAL